MTKTSSVKHRTPSPKGQDTGIRVLLVDDHEVTRQGLRTILKGEPDIEVVGEAASGEETLKIVKALEPDVILMDIRIKGMDGLQATRDIKKLHPNILVIMLTFYDSELYATEALRAGAVGYITKDCPRELLSNTIRVVAQGSTVWHGGLLHRARQGFLHKPSARQDNDDLDILLREQLTKRELEILTLLTEGCGNKQICTELNLAEITVKKHVRSIMTKLKVSNRTQAALYGIRLGLA